jgi:hypothetical protein
MGLQKQERILEESIAMVDPPLQAVCYEIGLASLSYLSASVRSSSRCVSGDFIHTSFFARSTRNKKRHTRKATSKKAATSIQIPILSLLFTVIIACSFGTTKNMLVGF